VLVNPRPASHGNENNFPSKLFDYALTGRAILTSDLSGVQAVLGADAFYFNPKEFVPSLREILIELARAPRTELRRRGAAVQTRVLAGFSWVKQSAGMAAFISEICGRTWAEPEVLEPLAA
jgi:hypothetical protein